MKIVCKYPQLRDIFRKLEKLIYIFIELYFTYNSIMTHRITHESVSYEDIVSYLNETKNQLDLYVRDVDYNHNINTPLFQIIKRKHQYAMKIIIEYLITNHENRDLQYIRDRFNIISNMIYYYNNIIESRINELKFRTSQLISELRRDRYSNNIDSMLQTIDIYNELLL